MRTVRLAVILWVPEDEPLPKLSVIVALLAAIMLVIGGTPVRASAGQCDPCPPDCPMMAQASAEGVSAAPEQTPKSDPAESPCKAMVACPVAMALPTPPQALTVAWALPKDVRQRLVNARLAPSRPPDRALRPPISL